MASDGDIVSRLRSRIGGRFWLRFAAGAAISAGLLGALVWLADPAEIWAVVTGARLGPLVAAIGLYGLVLATRWVRLIGLVAGGRLTDRREGEDALSTRRRWIDLLWASAGHSFANQLLPARSGELVFPELWRRATGRSYAEGAVFLAAIRVVELGVVVTLYAAALGAWLWSDAGRGIPHWLIGAMLVAGATVIAALPWLMRAGLGLADRVIRETRLAEIGWLAPLREAIPRADRAVERLGRRERLWLVGTSGLMWAAMFGVFYCTVAACGADLGVAQTMVGSGGGIVGNLLPVGGIGSLGTMEAGWTAAFRATGAPAGPVVAAGLLVHAIVIAGTGIATVVGIAGSALAPGRRSGGASGSSSC